VHEFGTVVLHVVTALLGTA